MTVKLLTEHHLEFLSLIGGCTGSAESTLVNMPHYWKLHATAHFSPVENKNDLELDFKVFFFMDSCCSDIVDDESK